MKIDKCYPKAQFRCANIEGLVLYNIVKGRLDRCVKERPPTAD